MDPILAALDMQFARLDSASRELIALLDDSTLYRTPDGITESMEPWSCGELIARSAGVVEQTFGGLTTRLWDDPYEWTLPEKLADIPALLAYLDEVLATRQKGMAFISSDTDLTRKTPAPERLRSLGEILIETIAVASHYQGRAFTVFRIVTGKRPPRR